jgi:hypothetical protein
MNNTHKKDTFKRTMQQAQGHMSPISRAFSRFIHLRGIEIISDTLAKTLLRPSALLSGAVASIVLTLPIWIVSKHYGYQLSGTEPLASFLLGWILGLLYDYTSLIFVHDKRR